MIDHSAILAQLVSNLTFYRQKREDGGVRTGIMIGPNEAFERFEIKGEKFNPYLIWSIDLRCNGPALPSTPDDARDWLLANEAATRGGFGRFAHHLGSLSGPRGDDLLIWDDFPDLPLDVSMQIVCFARQRVNTAYLSRRMSYLGRRWATLIRALKPTFHEAL